MVSHKDIRRLSPEDRMDLPSVKKGNFLKTEFSQASGNKSMGNGHKIVVKQRKNSKKLNLLVRGASKSDLGMSSRHISNKNIPKLPENLKQISDHGSRSHSRSRSQTIRENIVISGDTSRSHSQATKTAQLL